MKKQCILEIQSYGDLGVKYTDSIYVSNDKHDLSKTIINNTQSSM